MSYASSRIDAEAKSEISDPGRKTDDRASDPANIASPQPITRPPPAVTNVHHDHITLSISSSSSPIPSISPFKAKRRRRTLCYSFLICLFNSLSVTMILMAAMLIILAGSIANMEDIAGMDPILRGLPSAMSLYSCFLLFTMIVGIGAYLLDSSWFTVCYSSLLVCLLLGQALYTDRLSQHLSFRIRSLTVHWDDLPPLGRDIVQVLGNCCGCVAVEDRPGRVCPEDADYGCLHQIKEIEHNLNNLFRGAFLANLFVFSLMAILLFYIVIYRDQVYRTT